MTKQEEFLDLYRQYESVLRTNNRTYAQIEENAEPDLQNQLRITRQIRNFLSHNPNMSFLMISDKQIQLLKTLIKEEQERGDILKHHISSPKTVCILEDTPLDVVLLRMCKQNANQTILYDKNKILGVMNIHKLIKMVYKYKSTIYPVTKITYGKLQTNFICCPPDTPMERIQSYQPQTNIVCCTSDGTPTGKFLGIYQP